MPTYIALKRIKVGQEHLMPGTQLPAEEAEGRNVNLLLRQGLIADLDMQSQSIEEWAGQSEAYRSRIVTLEGLLEDAQAEISGLRQGAAQEPAGSDASIKAEESTSEAETEAEEAAEVSPANLARLNKAQLLEVAQKRGVSADPVATNARLVELIQAGAAKAGE